MVWKAKILSILDRHCIKTFTLRIVAIPVDPADNEKYDEAMGKAKCIILDGVKDHVVQHIVEKETTKETWDALKMLYQHTSMQRKMLLENQLLSYQMQKGEQIDHFLGWLKEIRDQLTSIRAKPNQEMLVRTALNAVSEEWDTIIESILGRVNLPDWEELWADLRQEEIRRLSKMGSSSKGVWIKKEEEDDAALAYVGKQEKRKKKDLSKSSASTMGNWVIMRTSVRGRRLGRSV